MNVVLRSRFSVLGSPVLFICLLAALYTGLNALKPLHIDDAAYACYARQMASRPLDPYGFAIFWWDQPQPANEVLAPPVFPYFWALLRNLAGERPWLWKLGLFPWSLLLVGSLYALLRRFCRGVEGVGTVLLVLSPLLLPSFNLMLDVPSLALGLAALCLFFRAADRDSFALAAWAGLLAGLAMQTKYTALLVPVAMLLYAATHGRLRLGPVAALVAAQVFVTWEFLIALLYGRSHFLLALSAGDSLPSRVGQLPFLLSQLGGAAPAGILVALAALGLGTRWLVACTVMALLGYAAVTFLDVRFVGTAAPSALLFGPVSNEPVAFQMAEMIFHLFGYAGAVVVVLVARRLLLQDGDPRCGLPEERRSAVRDTRFLLAWLVLEVLGAVLLSPFPAVRRVFGVAVVLTLLVGRLAARTRRDRRRTFHVVTAAGVALGLAFFALDYGEAEAQRQAAEGAARWIRAHDEGGGQLWYVGHWGFQYYAERCGMRPLVPDYSPPACPIPLPPPSHVRAGDWLVVPDPALHRQSLRLDLDKLEGRETLRVGAVVPLRTVVCFYCGRTPLEHHEGPRREIVIYRVTSDFIPR
jgi:hypothetical protein